jgi:hypothetical protein
MMLSRVQIQEEIEQIKKEMAALRTERAEIAGRQEVYEQTLRNLEGIGRVMARMNGELPHISEAEIASMSGTKIILTAMKWRVGEKLHISEVFQTIKNLGCEKVTEPYIAMILSRLSRQGIVQREGKGIYLYKSSHEKDKETGER